jgi:protoporphyrin/coproporphyrin ferrochelatase
LTHLEQNPMTAQESPTTRTNTAVFLFNLGGPERLEDVRPFLYNLFSDPDIIRIRSDVLRKLVAWFISTSRQRKSRDLYRQIGGGSPLRRITEEQAVALAARLKEMGRPARVYVAMRCWNPTTDEALEQACRDGVNRLVALPLFPQFSYTTTGSCYNHLKKLLQGPRFRHRTSGLQVSYVDPWPEEPLYVESLADLVRTARGRFSTDDPGEIHLLYSAHSIPARYVTEGDPYLQQTQKTVRRVNDQLGNSHPFTISFQSKVGPVRWLGPSTSDIIAELGRARAERVLVIPISFVSDHIETLQEIDIGYKKLAADCGIREFDRVPALNTCPKFIDALAHIALRTM